MSRWLVVLTLLLLGRDATAELKRFSVEKKGFLYVWTPRGYDAKTAGIVIYVHGYYTDVDHAMIDHKLVQQFTAARRNAIYIIPEAPSGPEQDAFWPDLDELLATTARLMDKPLPEGPLVAMGHSAAHKTLVGWLTNAKLDHIVLLDAMYGKELEFLTWLDAMPGNHVHSMTVIAADTLKWAEPFIAQIPYAVQRKGTPSSWRDLKARERRAKVLYIRSTVGHMDMVTGGKVIPAMLRRSPLPPL